MGVEINKIRNTPVFFIVGKGRSGTTLLQSLLNNHPAIIAPPETMLIPLLYPWFGKKKNWSDSDINLFVSKLSKEGFFARLWKIDLKKLTTDLQAAKEELDYSTACKIVCLQTGKEKADVKWFAFKSPDLTLFMDELTELFPNARFIHLVREPRDNVYSHIVTFNAKITAYIAKKWLEYNKLVEVKKTKMPDRFLTIKYEEMVSQPQTIMKGLCGFLNIEYTDAVTQNNASEVLTNQAAQKSLKAPVNKENIDKWKTGMKLEDRAITETITAEYANKQYGYAKDVNGGSKASYFKILYGSLLYNIWVAFTRARYSNRFLNNIYYKLKPNVLK